MTDPRAEPPWRPRAAILLAALLTVAARVVVALSRLDDGCRELLARTFLEDIPYSQLATDMGLAESSVRAKVSRCLGRARELAA